MPAGFRVRKLSFRRQPRATPARDACWILLSNRSQRHWQASFTCSIPNYSSWAATSPQPDRNCWPHCMKRSRAARVFCWVGRYRLFFKLLAGMGELPVPQGSSSFNKGC